MSPVAISDTFFVLFFGAIAVGLVFALGNWWTKRTRGGSTAQDVVTSIETLFGPGSMDEWEFFLEWPIADPYLESVRQRCRAIYEEHDAQPGQYMTDQGIRLVGEVLAELKQHIDRKRPTFNA